MIRFVVTFLLLLVVAAPTSAALNEIAGELFTLTTSSTAPNGAWSWFEDERAIVDETDPNNRLLLVSSVSAGSGAEGGDIDLLWLNMDTGQQGEFELSDRLQQDDHDSASLVRRPDGRYIAAYGRHSNDNWMRVRISTNPGDPTSWGPEQLVDASPSTSDNATYNNLHFLAGENGGQGRLYNLTRAANFNPNLVVSNDLGESWTQFGRLMTDGSGGVRPYVRYFSDGEAIHFFATDGHPRDVNNNVYHGVIRDGQLFNSDGSLLDANLFDDIAVAPNSLTHVFEAGTPLNEVPMTRAWVVDLAIDEQGNPYGVFQTRIDPGDLSGGQDSLDHQFFYARYNGNSQSWNVQPLALAGRDIYSASPNGSEDDYTGLVAVDPSDPSQVFISTPIDPRTQVEMQHYEIFRGETTDEGATWQWEPITFNSTVDNLRPIIPASNADDPVLLWMRGTYNSYTSWSTEVVALTEYVPIVETSRADLTGDGKVDLADYTLYLAGLHADFSGISDPEIAHGMGDLNGDFRNDFYDFLIFEEEYSLLNGMGSLSRDVLQVPEPAAMGIGGVASILILRWRADRR